MTTETVLTKEQRESFKAQFVANGTRPHLTVAELSISLQTEQAVLQSLTGDADRIEAAARMLSKCLDYPWEFMTSQGHDSMREYARATINAAMEKQP